jgi:hypothetical protein
MFGPAVPDHSIILLLSVVFCIINPLVLCCGLAFFAMALVVESYNWGWVSRGLNSDNACWMSELRGATL